MNRSEPAATVAPFVTFERGSEPQPTARRRTASVALVAGSAIFLSAEFVAATAWTDPPYSYTYNYISDLGIHGPATVLGHLVNSPLAVVMNAGFFLFGISYLVGVALLEGLRGPARWMTLFLGAAVAGGGVLLAFNPGTGDPPDGSVDFHGLGALASIAGGNLLVLLLGLRHRSVGVGRHPGRAMVALGAFGLASLVAFFAYASSGHNVVVGLVERAAVYPILAGFVRAGVSLWADPAP